MKHLLLVFCCCASTTVQAQYKETLDLRGEVYPVAPAVQFDRHAEVISIDDVTLLTSESLFFYLIELTMDVNDLICYGDSSGAIILTVSGGIPGYTYLWSNGATTQNLVELPAGIYSVTVTDNAGITATEWTILLEPPTVSGTLYPYDNPVCVGNETILYVDTIFGGSGGPYSYSVDNGVLLSPDFPVSVSAGMHLITYYDKLACSATDTISIEVAPASNASITGPDTVCLHVPGEYHLPGNFTDYQWIASGNSLIEQGQGSNMVSVRWNTAGAATLTVYFANDNDCPDTAVLNLLVDICTGTHETTLPGVQVLNNPFGDWLLVQFDRPVEVGTRLRLTDAQGRLWIGQAVTTEQFRLETDHLPSGLYILSIVEGERTAIWKLVKPE